jgi:hypothetical protein
MKNLNPKPLNPKTLNPDLNLLWALSLDEKPTPDHESLKVQTPCRGWPLFKDTKM